MELTDCIGPAILGLMYLMWIYPTHSQPPADKDSPYDEHTDL